MCHKIVVACLVLTAGISAAQAGRPQDATGKHEPLGSVAGQVTYRGMVPESPIADNAGHRRPLLTVGRSSGLQDAVVYLVAPDDPKETAPERPAENQQRHVDVEAREPVVIDQQDHRFAPHMIALEDGQQIRFTNSDAANHNVRASSLEPRNNFNVFTGAGRDYTHRFHHSGRVAPVRIDCDLHPWMTAYVYVFPHRRFAVTDERGKFRIEGIAPGRYQLVVVQPDAGLRKQVEIDVQPDSTLRTNIGFTADELRSNRHNATQRQRH